MLKFRIEEPLAKDSLSLELTEAMDSTSWMAPGVLMRIEFLWSMLALCGDSISRSGLVPYCVETLLPPCLRELYLTGLSRFGWD